MEQAIYEPMSERIYLRCTPSMKQQLEEIAAQSVSKELADHVRFALEKYIEQHQAQLEGPQPA